MNTIPYSVGTGKPTNTRSQLHFFVKPLDRGFTKFQYYLFHWNSRNTAAHHHRRTWPKQTEYSVGYSNIKWNPSFDPINCNEFFEKLTTKSAAWNNFAAVVRGFSANYKAENYVELVANIMKTCSKKDCRVFFKVHMLDANLDQFKKNMGAYSKKLGERFHQNSLLALNARCCPVFDVKPHARPDEAL